MYTLISLVGEQPGPNLIPLFIDLFPSLDGKPAARLNRVQLLASNNEQIRGVAEHLRKAISEDPVIMAIQVAEPDEYIDAFNLEDARSRCQAIIQRYRNAGDEVLVNLTGGTKIMSMALYQAAIACQAPMIYINSEGAELVRFDTQGNGIQPSENFEVNISIETQLRATGNVFKPRPQIPVRRRADVPREKVAFTIWLLDNYQQAYVNGIKRITDLREKVFQSSAGGKNWPQEIILTGDVSARAGDTFGKLVNLKILRSWEPEARKLVIPSLAAWKWLDGGWVEDYALSSLADCGFFDDVLGNVEIAGFVGEVDVVVAYNGRFGIVECKTKGPHGEGVAALASKMRQYETIFGGPYARTIFALASDAYFEDYRRYLKQYGIPEPVCGPDLKELPAKLSRLFQK